MIPITRFVVALLVLAPVCMTSCTPPNTKLEALWRDQTYAGHPRRILVIGVLPNPDNRRLFEDVMEKQLKAEGTDAVAGHGSLPDLTGVDRDKVVEVMNSLGAETVLVTRLADRKSVENIMPTMHSFAFAASGNVQSVRDEFAVVQTNLYDLKTNKLIWSAASETWLIDRGEKLMQGFGRAIIGQLKRDKVLASGAATK